MKDENQVATSVYVVGSFVVACCAKLARFPRPGETLNAASFLVEAGGKGFNLAVAVRRLGANVAGIFGIGDDIFAEFAEQSFKRADLAAAMLVRYPTATACGVGFTDASGENCIAVYAGANGWLSAADVEPWRSTILASQIVLAQFEAPDPAISAAFAIARAAGRPTLLNPSPSRDIEAELLAVTSILVVNQSEASQLARTTPRGSDVSATSGDSVADPIQNWATLASELMRAGPDIVVVTLGERGAVAFERNSAPAYQPAFDIDVQDTIGCGDAFTAAFAMALVEGRSVVDSLKRASASGAIVAGRLGTLHALPNAAELESFLARSDLSTAKPIQPASFGAYR